MNKRYALFFKGNVQCSKPLTLAEVQKLKASIEASTQDASKLLTILEVWV